MMKEIGRIITDSKGTEKPIYPGTSPNLPIQGEGEIKRPTFTTYEEALEWNKQAQKHTEQAISFTQEYAKRIVEPQYGNRIMVVNVSDVHWGHFDVDYDYVDQLFNLIEKTPDTYCIFGWNLLDAAIPAQFPDGVMWSGQTAQEQVYTFRDKLRRLDGLHKILGAIGDSRCYDGETEVLVRNHGFVRFDALLKNEFPNELEVATLNLQTGEFEWQKPTRWIKKWHKGKIYNFVNQKVNFMVTPDHNMLYFEREDKLNFKRIEARNWEQGGKQFVKGSWNWKGVNKKKLFGYDAILFMQLLGWYISEGYVHNLKKGNIEICQKKESKYYLEICELLKKMGIHPIKCKTGVQFTNRNLAKYLKKLGYSWNKFIPDEFKQLSKRHLLAFLYSYWKGDGYFGDGKRWRKKDSPICCSTASKRLASDLVEIIIKCGWGAMFSEWEREAGNLFPNGKRAKTRRTQYNVNICRNIFPHFRSKPKIREYDDYVYCLSVPNEVILVRRKGKVAYNFQCHEGWMKRTTGWMIYRELFEGIDVPLLLNGGYLDVQVKDESYRIGLFHKIKYWSQFNKTHGGDRAMDRLVDAEIVFTSHLHQAATGQSQRYNPPFTKETAVVSSGTCKLHDKFARGMMGSEGEKGGQAIILWADKHKFNTVFDLEVGSEMMFDMVRAKNLEELAKVREAIKNL